MLSRILSFWRRSRFGVALLFFFALFSPCLALESQPSAESLLAQFGKELSRLHDKRQAEAYYRTHLLKGFGDASKLVAFANDLTGGEYTAEAQALIKGRIKLTHVLPDYSSLDEVEAHLHQVSRKQPVTARIHTGLTQLGYGLSAASIANDMLRYFQGDDDAMVRAGHTAWSTTHSYALGWATQKGIPVGTAGAGIAFLGHALTEFATTQHAQYEEFWWNAYVKYHQKVHPSLVKGNQSWAALAEEGGIEAVSRRLDSFWKDSLENAAIYYKTPSPFQRNALAVATFKKPFAARYYHDYLHKTLVTYFQRKAAKARAAAIAQADQQLNEVRTELNQLALLRTALIRTRKRMSKAGVKRVKVGLMPPKGEMTAVRIGFYALAEPGATYDATLVYSADGRTVESKRLKLTANDRGVASGEKDYMRLAAGKSKHVWTMTVKDALGNTKSGTYTMGAVDNKKGGKTDNQLSQSMGPVVDKLMTKVKSRQDSIFAQQEKHMRKKQSIQVRYSSMIKRMEAITKKSKADAESMSKEEYMKVWGKDAPKRLEFNRLQKEAMPLYEQIKEEHSKVEALASEAWHYVQLRKHLPRIWKTQSVEKALEYALQSPATEGVGMKSQIQRSLEKVRREQNR